MSSEIRNIDELTTRLCDSIDGVKTGKLAPDAGNAIANIAGKLIRGVSVEIEYTKARRDTPEIPFMDRKAEV